MPAIAMNQPMQNQPTPKPSGEQQKQANEQSATQPGARTNEFDQLIKAEKYRKDFADADSKCFVLGEI